MSRMYLMNDKKAQYVTFEIYPEHYGYPNMDEIKLIFQSDSSGDEDYVWNHIRSEWVKTTEYQYMLDCLYADHMPTAWSLHDHDRLPDGSMKKPHIHVVKLGNGGITGQRWRDDLGDLLTNGYLEKVGDIRGMVRYLVHIDDPDKYQYPVSNIKTYNMDLLDYFYTDLDWLQIDADIIESIKTFHFTDMQSLFNAYKDNRTYLRRIINRAHIFKIFMH